MLGQEAAPAWEQWQWLGEKSCPQAGRACQQSLGALLTQPGGFQLSVGSGPPATAQHGAHPALPAVQLCPEAHTIMPKQSPHVPRQPPAPATLWPHPQDFLPPFSQPTLAMVNFIAFKEKLYNLMLSNGVWVVSPSALEQRHKASCWTLPTADTSPASCESCQALTALTQTRLIFSFTCLLIHR